MPIAIGQGASPFPSSMGRQSRRITYDDGSQIDAPLDPQQQYLLDQTVSSGGMPRQGPDPLGLWNGGWGSRQLGSMSGLRALGKGIGR